MPILFVKSHNDVPIVSCNAKITGTASNLPSSVAYSFGGANRIGVLVSTPTAIEKLISKPRDMIESCSGSSYELELTDTRRTSKVVLSENGKMEMEMEMELEPKPDYEKGIYRIFEASECMKPSGVTKILSPLNSEDSHTRFLMAILESLGTLPVIAVLQGIIFDPKMYDVTNVKTKDGDSGGQDELISKYPYGILCHPKSYNTTPNPAISGTPQHPKVPYPVFYSGISGRKLFDSHTDKDGLSLQYQNPILENNLLGGIEETDPTSTITAKLKQALIPILERELKMDFDVELSREEEIELMNVLRTTMLIKNRPYVLKILQHLELNGVEDFEKDGNTDTDYIIRGDNLFFSPSAAKKVGLYFRRFMPLHGIKTATHAEVLKLQKLNPAQVGYTELGNKTWHGNPEHIYAWSSLGEHTPTFIEVDQRDETISIPWASTNGYGRYHLLYLKEGSNDIGFVG